MEITERDEDSYRFECGCVGVGVRKVKRERAHTHMETHMQRVLYQAKVIPMLNSLFCFLIFAHLHTHCQTRRAMGVESNGLQRLRRRRLQRNVGCPRWLGHAALRLAMTAMPRPVTLSLSL